MIRDHLVEYLVGAFIGSYIGMRLYEWLKAKKKKKEEPKA